MNEAVRIANLKRSAQKLQKIIKMGGTINGVFAFQKSSQKDKKHGLVIEAGKTSQEANLKKRIQEAGMNTGQLICGQVVFDKDAWKLYLTLESVGSVKLKVKKSSTLKEGLKQVATGNLKILQTANITSKSAEELRSGISSETSESSSLLPTSTEEEETVSSLALLELMSVETLVEDIEEIKEHLTDTGAKLTHLDSIVLTHVDERESMLRVAAFKLFVGDGIRVKIQAYAKAHQRVLTEGELADLIVEETSEKDSLRPYVLENLRQPYCGCSVQAAQVNDFNLGDYDNPLNHGLIQVYGLPEYTTIERGSQSALDRPRRHKKFHPLTFVEFGSLLGTAYRYGGGELVSTSTFSARKEKRKLKYTGFVEDCWTHISNIFQGAGLGEIARRHIEDEGNYRRWQQSGVAKSMRKLGVMDDSYLPVDGVAGDDDGIRV